MDKYEVIAEFVDRATGERYRPAARGEEPVLFAPRDAAQLDRLTGARCLGSEPVDVIGSKPVDELSRDELLDAAVAVFREQISEVDDDELREGVRHHREAIAEREARDLTKRTVEQLKAIAIEESIDLGDATRKADIVVAIEAARAA